MLQQISVPTTGSAGSATGSQTGTLQLRGYLMGVRIDYDPAAPATTIVTITEAGGMRRTLLTAPASATDVTFNPQALVNKPDGTSAAFYWPFYLDGVNVTVAVSASDELAAAVVVTLSVQKDM